MTKKVGQSVEVAVLVSTQMMMMFHDGLPHPAAVFEFDLNPSKATRATGAHADSCAVVQGALMRSGSVAELVGSQRTRMMLCAALAGMSY